MDFDCLVDFRIVAAILGQMRAGRMGVKHVEFQLVNAPMLLFGDPFGDG